MCRSYLAILEDLSQDYHFFLFWVSGRFYQNSQYESMDATMVSYQLQFFSMDFVCTVDCFWSKSIQ